MRGEQSESDDLASVESTDDWQLEMIREREKEKKVFKISSENTNRKSH